MARGIGEEQGAHSRGNQEHVNRTPHIYTLRTL